MRNLSPCVLMVAGASWACSDADMPITEGERSESSIGELGQELNSSCGTYPAQYTFGARITPTLVTPNGSGGCQGNSTIVDIHDIDMSVDHRLRPTTAPTNEAACEGMTITMYVWEKTSSGPVFLGSSGWDPGVWVNLGQPQYHFCLISASAAENIVGIEDGGDYRFGLYIRDVNGNYVSQTFYSSSS